MNEVPMHVIILGTYIYRLYRILYKNYMGIILYFINRK